MSDAYRKEKPCMNIKWINRLAPAVALCGLFLLPHVAGAAIGDITEFPIPTAGSNATGITSGPDGALWFTEINNSDAIGRITTAGVITRLAQEKRRAAWPCVFLASWSMLHWRENI